MPVYQSPDGVLFVQGDPPGHQVTGIPEYWYSDIGSGDRVLDIGANIGAFCIRAARMSRHVTAVEPVTTGLLAENIRLNGADVRVLPVALGDGNPAEISWGPDSAVVPTFTLAGLIDLAGGCDFLKCDCEGAEWTIDPRDLAGVRRIEMELHQPPIGPLPAGRLLDYLTGNYEVVIDRNPVHAPLGQMGVLHAWRPLEDRQAD